MLFVIGFILIRGKLLSFLTGKGERAGNFVFTKSTLTTETINLQWQYKFGTCTSGNTVAENFPSTGNPNEVLRRMIVIKLN